MEPDAATGSLGQGLSVAAGLAEAARASGDERLAEETAAEWATYHDEPMAHFAEMKRVLDRDEPDYKD